jgi:hypothetical protein
MRESDFFAIGWNQSFLPDDDDVPLQPAQPYGLADWTIAYTAAPGAMNLL